VTETLGYTYISPRVMCNTVGHNYTTHVSLWVEVMRAVFTVSLTDICHFLYFPLGFPVPFSSPGEISPTLCAQVILYIINRSTV